MINPGIHSASWIALDHYAISWNTEDLAPLLSFADGMMLELMM